jgi:hypothetical protein
MGTPENIQAATGVAPGLDPNTAVAAGIAATNPAEAVQNAAATAQVGATVNKADSMRSMSVSQQHALWNGSNHAEQSQLRSMGYTPPPDPATTHPSSFWGHLFGDVEHAATDVGRAAMSVYNPISNAIDAGSNAVVNQGLNALAVPERYIQYGYRTATVVGEAAQAAGGSTPEQIAAQAKAGMGGMLSGESPPNILATLKAFVSPSQWARGYRESANGEKTFDPAIERSIQDTTDPNTFSLAKDLASGDTEQSLVAATPQANQQALVEQIRSPQVQKIVQQLNAAHLSIGREVVGEQFMVQHPALGNKISGAIDATFDVVTDPTMHAGAVLDVARVARAGITGEQAAEHINQLRELNPAAEHLDQATSAIPTENPVPVLGQAQGAVGTGEDVRATAYSVPNTTEYYAKLQNAGPQRWITTIGNDIQLNGISHASTLDSRVAGIESQLAEAKVHDASSLEHWMAGEAGVKAVMSGQAAAVHGTTALLPTLTRTGLAKIEAKGLLSQSINWLSEKGPSLSGHVLSPEDISTGLEMGDHTLDALHGLPSTGDDLIHADGPPLSRNLASRSLGRMGALPARNIRQMTTLAPTSGVVDLTDARTPTMLRRLLQYSLPAYQVNKIADAFMAETELGAKRTIYRGGIHQMLVNAGVYGGSDRMAKLGDEVMNSLDETFHAGTFGPHEVDKMPDGTRTGIGLNQMSTHTFMPGFKEVYAASRRDAFYHKLGIPAPDTMDKVMKYWKAGVLLRPGFAFRVSLSDEAFGTILRNGVGSYLMGRSAAHVVRHAALDEMDGPTGKIAMALAAVTNKVPTPILDAAKTGHDMATAVYAHAAHAAYRLHGGQRTLPEYMDGADSWGKHVWHTDNVLYDNVASVAHGGASGDPEAIGKVSIGGTPIDLNVGKSGIYKDWTQGDPLFLQKWHFGLSQVADDKLSRVVLDNLQNGGRVFQRNRVLDLLKSLPEDELNQAERWNKLANGKIVGVDATREDALKSWASKVVEWAHWTLKEGGNVSKEDAKSGPMADTIKHMIEHGSAPDISELDKIHPNDRPMSAYGPEYVSVPRGPDQWISKGFHLASKVIDWNSRQPMTLHAYVEALHETRPVAQALLQSGGRTDASEELAAHMASMWALEKVKPFIHSPEIRSQYEIIHRTAMPFLFAQDQFLKRWGRTFIDSPEGIRKAQMMMHGLQTSGIVHKDQNGNDQFTYPGSQVLTGMVSGVMHELHIGASLPISVPFTGQVMGGMPGLNNPITPSVGPTVAIPLKALSGMFPELQPAQQALLQGGASTNYLDQILPSTLSRMSLYFGSPNMSGQFASSMISAMALMDANGFKYPEKGNSTQKQEYIDRLKNWTRTLFVTKGILGFFAPASPTANFDAKNLNSRLRTLIGELGYNNGISEFMKEQPDANAYTVFHSSATGDVPNLPSTKAAGQFISQNRQFVKDYPKAAGWFIPRTLGNQPYDPAVYREQLTYAMRAEKLPSEFLTDLTKASAAATYYQSETNYYNAYAQTTGANAKAQLRNAYDQWQSTFMAQNPTFADYMTSGGASVKRVDTLRELETVLANGKAPQSPQTDHVSVMMQSFENYETAYMATDGNFASSVVRQQAQLKSDFTAWAVQYTATNPDVADLYNVLIKPELGAKALTQGALPNG